MAKRFIYALIASIFGVLGSSMYVSATSAGCDGAVFAVQGKLFESVEKQVAASTFVAQAEVISSESLGTQQKIGFRLLKSWKGPFQEGESVSLTLPVTEVCAGFGCVFPFKVGDVALLLTTSFSYHEDLPGCWVYEGVAIHRVLSVPAAELPNTHH